MQNVKILKRSGPIPLASSGGSVEHKTLLRRPDTKAPKSSGTVPPPKSIELKDVPPEYQELLCSMSSLAAEAGAEMESQIYALVEAEQTRLDEAYGEMQKNLLRSISSTINEYLPEVIKAKIAEEIAKVAEDVSATLKKSIQESTQSSFQTAIEAAVASTKEEASSATAEALRKVATSAKVREAFGSAFIKVLLPSFEDSTRSFLSSFSVAIGDEVEQKITIPLRQGSEGLSSDLADLKKAQKPASDALAAHAASREAGKAAKADASSRLPEVKRMLAAGDYGGALKLASGLKDADILNTTVEATLAEDIEPGQSTSKLNYHDAVLVLTTLAKNHTSQMPLRLRWLSDLSVLFADEVDIEEEEGKETPISREELTSLKETVQIVHSIRAKDLSSEETRAKKLTIHLLNSHLRTWDAKLT
eukprot:CAMPEP_0184753924 /NCGR_PEP_ID=MMETSP0315-20130426/44355_1 /TAXON_ID=101924 /ORGANISM="Rhodosorus marinus, Strain UTEX LB 2760" /LENGTH=418 /DNA_ID=CAMNT_0027233321 /DNA_START=361 /DNA_END=1617 /DNA_ORIENTATION=-